MFGKFDVYVLLNIKTAQNIANNLINENIYPLKINSLRQDWWYLVITNLYKNTHFTYKLFHYTFQWDLLHLQSCVKW